MILLLTISLCVGVLGLLLLVLGLRPQPTRTIDVEPDRSAESEVTPPASGEAAASPATAEPARRRWGLLIAGAVLALIGGLGTVLLLNEGLESDRLDHWLIRQTPNSMLIGRLDSDNSSEAMRARTELERRARAEDADDDLRQALTERHVEVLLAEGEPQGPGSRVFVEMDLEEGRDQGWIDDEKWSELVAQSTALRYEVPTEVQLGEPLVSELTVTLSDPTRDDWVIARFDDLAFAGEPTTPPQAVLVAPNPNWQPPAEGEGGVSRAQRTVRVSLELPADVVATAQPGEQVYYAGQFTVYAFTGSSVPVPEDVMSRAVAESQSQDQTGSESTAENSDAGPVPAVVMVRLSDEEAQSLVEQALGTWTLPMTREIQVVE